MRRGAQDREAKPETPVQPRRGDEDASIILDGFQQPLVIVVGISFLWQPTESDDRKVGDWSNFHSLDFADFVVEVVRQQQLFLKCRPEWPQPDQLQGKPETQPAERSG